jgi:protein-disulfide isomerase
VRCGEREAKELGLDVQQFDACRRDAPVRAAVQRDVELGGRLGIASTPTFFINGRQIVGAQPLEEFVSYINHELRLAGVSAH